MKKILGSFGALLLMCSMHTSAKSTMLVKGTEYTVDTIFHAKVGPGTTQTHLDLKSENNARLQVFYLTVERKTPGLSMRAVCGKDMVAGTERPSAMAKRKSGNGVLYFAGTNGDFFATSGNATNGSSKIGTPTFGCTADRETYKTSNGQIGVINGSNNGCLQFSVDMDGVARISRLWYYTGTATLGDMETSFLGFNVSSPDNGITLYTPKYWGSTNQTSKAGKCAEVTAKLVEGDKMYAGTKFRLEVTSTPNDSGDTEIPSDGVVIHGRGSKVAYKGNTIALDFVNSLKVGDIVEFDNVVLTDKGSTERIVPAQVVSGNPQIVSGGVTLDTEYMRDDASSKHPRTGIALSQTGDSIIMMVVDGRSAISDGVRTSQLADIMRYAGAWEALNLDGGGSSCLYTSAFGIRNTNSEGSERATGNGIFATVEAPEDTEIAEIRFHEFSEKVLPKYGYYKPAGFYGYNKYGVLVDADLQGVTLSCPAELGKIVNNGTTLIANGSGYHALTATYKGVSTTHAVKVENTTPSLRVPSVTFNQMGEYTVEPVSYIGENMVTLDNEAFTWSSDDESVATVDAAGVVKSLKAGKAKITGVVDTHKLELAVNVEVPDTRFRAIDKDAAFSTWSIKGANIESASVTEKPGGGIVLNFTPTATKQVNVTAVNSLPSWSRPDSISIGVNPGAAKIQYVYILGIDQSNPSDTVEYKVKVSGKVLQNQNNKVDIAMSEILDTSYAGSYPFLLTGIKFSFLTITKEAHKIDLPKVSWVYNSVPGSSAVEGIEAGEKSALQLSPNPVESGSIVRFGVSEAVSYAVSALNGAVVKQGTGVEVSTEGLSSGIYLVSVKTAEGVKAARLIVK